MFQQPFSEWLTNRTPSPAQQEDDGRQARKHSPWTAARQKKKTRSVQSSLIEPHTAAPECYDSPETLVKTGGFASDIEPEYSLADSLSPATSHSTASPHSSPPINRDEDAEVHPAKAYIVDQEASSPGDLLSKFASAANGMAPRSPMWFGSAALQDEVLDAAAAGPSDNHSELHHSSSAPSNVLFHQFDAVQQQQPESSQVMQQSSSQGQLVLAAAPAGPLPGRRRGLVARRRSWGGAEAAQKAPLGSSGPAAASNSIGISRLAASSCTSTSSIDLVAGGPAAAAAAGVSSSGLAGCGFELRSRLGLPGNQGGYDEDFLQRIPWDDVRRGQQRDDDTDDYKLAVCGELFAGASPDSVDWYEEKLGEAADDGDLAAAQQLWGCMQAVGLKPSRKVMINYLMCCHYSGGDPVEAAQVVREMCALAGTEPDGMAGRLLEAIDISWQQLHCGF